MLPEEKYCPVCTTPLEIKDVFGTQRPACPSCDHVVYHDPKVTATCIVEREGRILMIRRALQPAIGLWCMPIESKPAEPKPGIDIPQRP